MRLESANETQVSVRGVGTFLRPATRRTRALAVATDLPLHLLAPFTGVFFFNQAPLPALGLSLLWILAALGIHLFQKRVFGTTIGGRVWGLKSIENRGLMEKTSAQSFQVSGSILLVLSLFVATLMIHTILSFHPMLKRAGIERFAAFSPEKESKTIWTTLPFYYSMGSFPIRWDEQSLWYELPYGKGPPERFPPKVVVRLPGVANRLTIEAPRTPERLLEIPRDDIRGCLTSSVMIGLFSAECRTIRTSLLRHHTQEMIPGGQSPLRWELAWFEIDSEAQESSQRPSGVWLTARSPAQFQHRFILMSPEGKHQVFAVDSAIDEAMPEGTILLLKKVIGSVKLHADLAEPLEWIDKKSARTNFAAIRGGGDLEKLGQAATLLISQATVDPGDPNTYYELAGLAVVLLKKSSRIAGTETVAAYARLLAVHAAKFMRDVAPEDPRNQQVERMLLEVQGF